MTVMASSPFITRQQWATLGQHQAMETQGKASSLTVPTNPSGFHPRRGMLPQRRRAQRGRRGWGAAGIAVYEALSDPSKPHPRRPLAGADPTEPEAHLPPGRYGGEETTHRVPGGPHDPGGVAWGSGVAGSREGAHVPPRAHHSLRRRTRPCLAQATSNCQNRGQGVKKQGIT